MPTITVDRDTVLAGFDAERERLERVAAIKAAILEVFTNFRDSGCTLNRDDAVKAACKQALSVSTHQDQSWLAHTEGLTRDLTIMNMARGIEYLFRAHSKRTFLKHFDAVWQPHWH